MSMPGNDETTLNPRLRRGRTQTFFRHAQYARRMKLVCCLVGTVLLAACTPGGLPVSSGGGASPSSVVIDVNLTLHAPGSTPGGTGAGYAPLVTTVPVGSTIRFTNSDGFTHTATSISGATTFPSGFPFTTSALTQSGLTLSGGWSSGDMLAGTGSQTLLADKAGTYLYGCFHHYGAPMRAVIVVH
jgi:plastocyanin